MVFCRVFDQTTFKNLDDLLLTCIQFGYFMEGQTTVTLGVYIDKTGGAPDAASLRLVKSFDVTTINAVGQMQVQTVSSDTPIDIDLDDGETLVVIMTTPVMSEGFIRGGGQYNSAVKDTTYVGDCSGGYMTYASYVQNTPSIKGYNQYAQWYVRLHGANDEVFDDDKDKDSEDDDSLSTGAIAGISIGVIAGVAALGAVGYLIYSKKAKSSTSVPLISDPKI